MRSTGLLVASVALALLLACGVALAATGDLDRSFGGDGRVVTKFGEGANRYGAVDLISQPDGKIVALGGSGYVSSCDSGFAMVRYNADGSLDRGFGNDGRVKTGRSLVAEALVRQRDGKLVVVGNGICGGLEGVILARYNPNGTLDRSFGGDGLVNPRFDAYATDVIVQPDGKIVAAGTGDDGSGENDFGLVRFDPDGTLDEGFGEGGLVVSDFYGSEGVNALAMQPNGRLVAAGISNVGREEPGAYYDFALARYNRNGSLDGSFGRGGVVTTSFGSRYDEAHALVLQPDGKIVAGGNCCEGRRAASPTLVDFALVRYKPDGTLDGTFGTGGKVKTDFFRLNDLLRALVLQPDGKIVAAGPATNRKPGEYREYDFGLVRYESSGALDASFGEGGKLTTDFGGGNEFTNALVRQPDGRLVAAGEKYTYVPGPEGYDIRFILARYLR